VIKAFRTRGRNECWPFCEWPSGYLKFNRCLSTSRISPRAILFRSSPAPEFFHVRQLGSKVSPTRIKIALL
jgi:hypothetical protein